MKYQITCCCLCFAGEVPVRQEHYGEAVQGVLSLAAILVKDLELGLP
jgi:hypothetical protein